MINIGAWVNRDGRTMFYIMIGEKKGKRFIWKVAGQGENNKSTLEKGRH